MIPKLLLLATAHYASLTWQYNQPATFSVYRALYGTNEKYARRAEVKDTAWQDNDVIGGKTYCYYVTATVDKRQSSPSNGVCVLIPTS